MKNFQPKHERPDFNTYQLRLAGRPLSATQCAIFDERIHQLYNSSVQPIYRGDSLEKTLSSYNVDTSGLPSRLNDFLFTLGSKGRMFYNERTDRARTNGQAFSVDDFSNEFFARIFDMTMYVLFELRKPAGLHARIQQFAKRNPGFKTFFGSLDNRDIFLEKIRSLADKGKMRMRDYYLTFLHHVGNSEFYPYSFLLSATKSLRVAMRFVQKHLSQENEIIFFGWVPHREDYILFSNFELRQNKDLAEAIGLPAYTVTVFPEQHELSLKGGWLPHFMTGYLYTLGGVQHFEINPAFLQNGGGDWLNNGLPINQAEFDSFLRRSSYNFGFFVTDDGNFRELPNPRKEG